MALTTGPVEIPLEGGSFGGYLARPEGSETLPAVIVFMEIFGVNSHIRDVTERVAREGYIAIAPDYFHRTGPGVELAYDDGGNIGRHSPKTNKWCVPNGLENILRVLKALEPTWKRGVTQDEIRSY